MDLHLRTCFFICGPSLLTQLLGSSRFIVFSRPHTEACDGSFGSNFTPGFPLTLLFFNISLLHIPNPLIFKFLFNLLCTYVFKHSNSEIRQYFSFLPKERKVLYMLLITSQNQNLGIKMRNKHYKLNSLLFPLFPKTENVVFHFHSHIFYRKLNFAVKSRDSDICLVTTLKNCIIFSEQTTSFFFFLLKLPVTGTIHSKSPNHRPLLPTEAKELLKIIIACSFW